MKQYPEIEYFGDYWGLPIIAFEKIDGSNLRFEYSRKRGFYKFGTRNITIDRSSQPFGFAIDLFLNKYEKSLIEIFKSKTYREILSFVCFAELHGQKSAFGQHEFGNDSFDITLFDVSAYKKGLIAPRQFLKDFGGLDIPKVIYEGNLNKEFVSDVKNNVYGLNEGVVCKGQIPNRKPPDNLYYCKIKTNEWFDRLRNKRPDLYQEEINEHHLTQNLFAFIAKGL
jgi:hypothetical protein